MTLERLSGDWIVVEGTGSNYVKTADAITDAVTKLRAIADENESFALALTSLRKAAGKVAGQIQKAGSRYETTGTALVDYAFDLHAAQIAADAAIDKYNSAQSAVDGAEAEKNRIGNLPEAQSPAMQTTRESQLSDQTGILSSQTAVASEAQSEWRAAERRKNDAAEATIARIRDEIEDSDLNDSVWDNVWGGIKKFFDAIGDAITAALKWLAAAVLVVLFIIVVAIVAIALLVSGGLFALLAGAVLLTLLVLWIAGGGPDAFIANYMRTGDAYSAIVASVITVAQTIFPGFLQSLVDGDAGSPVRRWTGVGVSKFNYDGTIGEYFGRLQAGNVDVDAQTAGPQGSDLTHENSSMITVTKVEGPNGTFYRVNIPSTQQWSQGTSSINDIHSDAAAKLDLSGQTQLAEAVKDAMKQAGVAPGSSILMSGWSLGGITAGNLAADPTFNSNYNIKGVIVAGSSVDDAAIPKHIPVLTFSHDIDIVPRTENPKAQWHGDDANRTNVVVPAPPGAGPFGHGGAPYSTTMTEQGDLSGSDANEFFKRNNLEDYFAGIETPSSSIYQRGN